MTTTDLIDAALVSRFDAAGQPNSQTWRASSVGFCQRGQVLERLGVPKTRVMPVKEKRTLEWGNTVHDFVKGLLRETGCLIEPPSPPEVCPGCRPDEWHLEDPELGASAHLDAVLSSDPALVTDGDSRLVQLRHRLFSEALSADPTPKTWVAEIKGLKSSALLAAVRKARAKGPQAIASDHHLYQLGTQALIVKRNPSLLPVVPSYFELVMIGKDAFGYLSYQLPEVWIRKAEDWIGKLNECWSTGALPECQCMDWRKKYCGYPGEEGCCSPSLVPAAA